MLKVLVFKFTQKKTFGELLKQNTVYPIKPKQQFLSSASFSAHNVSRQRSDVFVRVQDEILPHSPDIRRLMCACFPLQQTRPRFKPLHSISAQTHTDAWRTHTYTKTHARGINTNVSKRTSLSAEAAGAWKPDLFKWRERASGFKMLLGASLCACSALATNPAQLHLRNSFLSCSKRKITNVRLVRCKIRWKVT